MPSKRVVVLHYEMKEGGKFLHDEVVDSVTAALGSLGHEPILLGAHKDVREVIDALSTRRPDLVFNLCEAFADDDGFEVQVASLLELCRVRFTGSGSQGLFLAGDKGIAKRLFSTYGVRSPDFVVFDDDHTDPDFSSLRFPLIVKPAASDASIGIDFRSVVDDAASMRKRVEKIRTEMKQDALAEEFLDGREFYVGALGFRDPVALPPVECDFSRLPPDRPPILDRRAKWVPGSREYAGTSTRVAEGLDPALDASLRATALDAVRALRVQDYARVDLRLGRDGVPNVLEVNPNPYLAPDSEYAMAARAAGLSYEDLVGKIVTAALQREPRRRRMLVSPPAPSAASAAAAAAGGPAAAPTGAEPPCPQAEPSSSEPAERPA